jgi:hypothetical protein
MTEYSYTTLQLDEAQIHRVVDCLVSSYQISLRDRFAMAALASLAHPKSVGEAKTEARYAYKLADAMLEAREVKSDP